MGLVSILLVGRQSRFDFPAHFRSFSLASPHFLSYFLAHARSLSLSHLLLGIWVGSSAAELAAIGLGNILVNVTALSAIQGLSGAMDTLASQAYGSGERVMVGVYAQRCLFLLLVMVVLPALPVWIFADHILTALHQDAETARLVRLFALVRIPGLLMQVLATVLQKFLNNQG